MSFCPVTGDVPCDCPHQKKSEWGTVAAMDYKALLRKIFTDHAVYTNWVILDSIPMEQSSAKAVTERLLRNPKDIRRVVEPFVGPEAGQQVEDLFTEHLVLAAGALEPARSGDQVRLKEAVQKFHENGERLGQALEALTGNPELYKMIHEHNQSVVDLVVARTSGEHEAYVQIYDKYYKHMIMLSDLLYQELTK